MAYEYLITEKDEGILTITINRPKQMNALNIGVVRELKQAVEDEAVADKSVRVIIITGSGDKAFVAGADISTMTEMGPLDVLEFAGCGQAAFALLESIDIPVIAGGIISEQDAAALKTSGIAEVFGPGTMTGDIIRWIETHLKNTGEPSGE